MFILGKEYSVNMYVQSVFYNPSQDYSSPYDLTLVHDQKQKKETSVFQLVIVHD